MKEIIPQVFSNSEFGEIRVIKDENSEPWFVAKDVCDILGYQNASKAISDHVDNEDKLNNETLSSLGQRGGWLINESGLYSLILTSKLPQAKAFKRWVTHEVLPSIRRDGGYMVAKDETPEETMARAFIIAQNTIERQKARIKQQTKQIEEMAPKALFADAVSASDGTCLVGELAKMMTQAGFTVGQNRLFAILREDGYLGKCGCNRNVPKQRYIEQGLFKIKETTVVHSDGHVTLNRTTKVSGKGQRFFVERYCGQVMAHA